jgi:putative membrane protein
MTGQTRSALKGALAGLIGGIAGAGAKVIAEQIFPPRTEGQTPPPVALAERVTGHPLPPEKQTTALQSIHWAFGALAGAAYGAIVELEPSMAHGRARHSASH